MQRIGRFKRNALIAAAGAFLLQAGTGAAIGQTAAFGSSQAADWRAIQAAARKEGRVVMYATIVAPVLQRLKEDFERANAGMVLEYSRIPSATQVAAKVEQERKTGVDGADLAINTEALGLKDVAREKLIKPPSGPSAKAWPPGYVILGAIPVLAMEPMVIAYNTNLVKTPITGYQDLLRPEFKGKIGTSDFVSPTIVAWSDWLEKTQPAGFLARFAAQNPRPYSGAAPVTQAVAAGEQSIAAFSVTTVAVPLIEQGAPLKVVVPKPSLGFRITGALLGWSKRPNAGLVLMDYLMSVRGQTTWSGRGETASPLPGIPGALDAQSVNPFDPQPYTAEVVSAYKERWNRLVKGQ